MSKKLKRGISEEFAKAFKQTKLYTLYRENKDDIIIGIRNNYLNLYYNCDSIARVNFPYNKQIKSRINNYYLSGDDRKSPKELTLTPNEISDNFETIKQNSNKRLTPEKNAQSKLFVLNNQNKDSNWFCIDIEYTKQFKNIQQREEANFSARFDFIAISKETPHRIALIELKYGRDAIGGDSGIYKHVKDFSNFQKNNYFNPLFTKELIKIIKSLNYLGVDIPFNTPQQDDFLKPTFYFIILNNNKKSPKHSSPKQSLGGYLFKEKRWDSKRVSTNNVEEDFGDITKKDNPFHATFLFSSQTLNNLFINDIIDGDYDERVEPE